MKPSHKHSKAPASQRHGGFTLIELMIVVAVIGVLASIAIPQFMKYLRKARTVEAVEAVYEMVNGIKSYYQAPHYDNAGNVLARTVPTPSVGPTPALGTCCAVGGRCPGNGALFNGGTWQKILFQQSEPHYYMYSYSALSATQFIARSWGDLDCDGNYSRFEMWGTGDTEASLSVKGPIIFDGIE